MLTSVLAANINNPAIPGLGTDPVAFLDRFLSALVGLGLVAGAVIFLIMLILGGIQWITSGGDKVANENARRRVTNALIGVFLLFSLYGIINLVSCFFGVNFLKIDIGPFKVGFGANPICPSAGGAPPPGGATTNANCGCGGSTPPGYCASTGTTAIGPGGQCYNCTSSGWVGPVGGSCNVISCAPCP